MILVADERARRQREEIVRALTESKGRVGGEDGAAARLGLNRTTLLSRMKKFGIDPKQFSSPHPRSVRRDSPRIGSARVAYTEIEREILMRATSASQAS